MIEKSKRKNSEPRPMIGCVVGLTITVIMPLGLIMLFAAVLPDKILASCEVQISDAISIQLRDVQKVVSRHYEYSITNDGGYTWQPFYTYTPDTSYYFEVYCGDISYIDETFIYLVPYAEKDESFFVTYDAGNSWHIWQTNDLDDVPQGFECHRIDSVNFQDANVGYMQLQCGRYHDDGTFWKVQNINLYTDDSGITWQPTYE